MTAWAICTVPTGREPQTAMLLAQRGREVYFPLVTMFKRSRRKPHAEPVETTAYKGYLFVQHSTIGDPEELYALAGFHYFLRTALGTLSLLPDSAIEWMRDNLECTQKPATTPLMVWKLWDKVRVPTEQGPLFGGRRGVVTAVWNRRVWVGGVDFPRPVLFPALLLEADGI